MPDTAPLSSRASRGTFTAASKAPRYARGDSYDLPFGDSRYLGRWPGLGERQDREGRLVGQPAIDRQHLTGDVRAEFARQEQERCGDFMGLRCPPQRDRLFDQL